MDRKQSRHTSSAQEKPALATTPSAEGETPTWQWAYQGKALYFYAQDTEVGQAKGVSAAWPLAQPK
jgi:predicted lipoprotein with Yx(FWY)xxD motif